MIGLAAAAAVLLLVLAASSGPTKMWVTPTSNESPTSVGGGSNSTTSEVWNDSTDVIEWPGWIGAALQIAGVGVVVFIVLAYVAADKWAPRLRRGGRMAVRRKRGGFDTLATVRVTQLVVDAEATRAALQGGTARNAIVACWMQLERAATAAGLPRIAAETPAEYVQRVVTAASVDPEPIGQLAALYREARFSRHALGEEHRGRAVLALHRVVGALDVPESVAV